MFSGQERAAFIEFRETADSGPFPGPCNGLGMLSLNWLGDPERAEMFFRKAVERAPKRADRPAFLARVLAIRGEARQALNLVQEAIKTVHDYPRLYAIRGAIELQLHDLDAALASYLQSLQYDLDSEYLATLARVLCQMPSGYRDARLDDLAGRIPVRDSAVPDNPRVLSAGAMVLLRAAERRDPSGALEAAERAVALAGRRFPRELPDLLATLAVVRFETGARAEAVRTLERAVRLPHARRHQKDLLRRYREGLPDLAISYATVDARGRTSGWNEEPLPASEGRDDEKEARARMYRAARILGEKGGYEAAELVFRELAHADPRATEPHLRVSECLAARGDVEGAETYLREQLTSTLGGDREVWNRWIAMCFSELSLDPGAVASRLLGAAGEPETEIVVPESIRQVLAVWSEDSWLGILCGASEDREIKRRRWFRDFSFHGGMRKHGPAHGTPEPTPVDKLYEYVRRFPHGRLSGGYTIPVPPGLYRVTVLLSSRRCGNGAARPNELCVEGKPFTDCEEIELEFTNGSRNHVELRIDDGLLNLEIAPRRPGTDLAAVEVEYLE
jgi:tetratricopeptide (TPR) repeat protein